MITLAHSSLCCHYIDDILSLAKNSSDRAIEWDMNFIPPSINAKRSESIISDINEYHLNIRYHLPYSFLEIAHTDHDIQKFSILTIKRYLDYIKRIDGHYAVLHVGYDSNSNESIALQSLRNIALYAKDCNVCICIENLIKGLTTNVSFIQQALEIDNVYLCLDTGHAHVVSISQVRYLSTLIKMLEKCVHAHVYYTEDENYNHIPFDDSETVQKSNIIKALLSSKCNWFTMELDKKSKQKSQMRIMRDLIAL